MSLLWRHRHGHCLLLELWNAPALALPLTIGSRYRRSKTTTWHVLRRLPGWTFLLAPTRRGLCEAMLWLCSQPFMPPPCSNPTAPAACTPVDVPTGWDPRADCLPCLRQGRPVPGCGYPASASCLERHSRLADRCPSLGSLFPPQAAVASAANPAVKTKKDQYTKCTGLFWSEQRDLNPRPPRPERGALPTALCPENTAADWAAVWLGMRESNSHK